MSFLADWQKRQRDLKKEELDRKKNASSILRNYRGGEHAILDQIQLKDLKDAERDSKLNASKLLHRYRSGWDSAQSSERSLLDQRVSFRSNADGENDPKVVHTPAEDLMGSENMLMTKSESSSENESDGESHVVDIPTENFTENEDISMTKSKSTSGSNESKRSISEKSILHFALQSFVSFSSSRNIEESTHNSDKEINHKGGDVETGKKGILAIEKIIEGNSSLGYKNDDHLTFSPSEDENIDAAHHRSSGNQDRIEDVINSGCSPMSEITRGELDSGNDESNKKIQWSSSYEETKESSHGKIRSTETSSCNERNIEKTLISETPTVESSQHEQTKPLFLRDIMFKGDRLGSLPKSHHFIRDENFHDAKEELLDNENISGASDSFYKRKVVRFAQDYELYDQMDHDDIITNRNDVLDIYHEAMESPYYERKDPYRAYSKADFYRTVYSDEIETTWDYDSENDDESNTDNELIRNLMYVVGGNVISIVISKVISAIQKTSEDVRGSFTAAELLTEEPLHAFDLATDSTASTAIHTGSGATSTLNSTGSMATTSSANPTANVTNTAATLRTASSSVTSASISATSSTSATSVAGVASGTTSTSSISAASSASVSAVSSSTTAGAAATGTAAASATATSSTAAAVTAQMAVSAAGTATASVSSAAVIVGATVATGSATAGTTATVTATTIAGLAAIAVTSTLGPSMECERNDERMASVKISFTEDFWNSNDMEGIVSTSRGWDQFGNNITEAYNSLSNCSEIFSREMSNCSYRFNTPRSDGMIDTYWSPSVNCNGCPLKDPLFGFGVDSNPDPITRMLQDFDPLIGEPSPSIEPPSYADSTTSDGTNVTEFLINKAEFLQLIGAESIEYVIDTALTTDLPSSQPSVLPSYSPSNRPITPSIVSFGTNLFIEDEVSIPDIKEAYTAATSEIIGNVKRDRYLIGEDKDAAKNAIVSINVQPMGDCKVDSTCVAVDTTVKFQYTDEAERAETTIEQSIENGNFGSILKAKGRFDVQDLSLSCISVGAFSESPSQKPSLCLHPSASPSTFPSTSPSISPSNDPSTFPSSFPSQNSSTFPSTRPSLYPSSSPSNDPTLYPSTFPTSLPSLNPSKSPSSTVPSSLPTRLPSFIPSASPTWPPSSKPSALPSDSPSSAPSTPPSASPSVSPTFSPSSKPSASPSGSPSGLPSLRPSSSPSVSPTSSPSSKPSALSSGSPSRPPSNQPSSSPSLSPTFSPSNKPSASPSGYPSDLPSLRPSSSPSVSPTFSPSSNPSALPSGSPSGPPSSSPSLSPSASPTFSPSSKPSAPPSGSPSGRPSSSPSLSPSCTPTLSPSSYPTFSGTFSPCNEKDINFDVNTQDCPRVPGEKCGELYPNAEDNTFIYMFGCFESCCPDSPCENYVPGPAIGFNTDDFYGFQQDHYCVCLPNGIPCTPSTNVPDDLGSCSDCCGGFLPSGENFVCSGCSDPEVSPPSCYPNGQECDSISDCENCCNFYAVVQGNSYACTQFSILD